MTAFDTAVATLFADPNLAQAATFAPLAGGSVPVRVIMRAPDVYQKIGSAVIDTPSQTLEVKVADCPLVSQGDQFIVGTTTYIVQGEPRRDELRLTWQVDIYAP